MVVRYLGVLTALFISATSYADLPISAEKHLAANKEIRGFCNKKHNLPAQRIPCRDDKYIELKKTGDVRNTEEYFQKYYKPASDEQLFTWLKELEVNEVDGPLPAYIYTDEIVWITDELHRRKAYPGARYEYGMIYMPVED